MSRPRSRTRGSAGRRPWGGRCADLLADRDVPGSIAERAEGRLVVHARGRTETGARRRVERRQRTVVVVHPCPGHRQAVLDERLVRHLASERRQVLDGVREAPQSHEAGPDPATGADRGRIPARHVTPRDERLLELAGLEELPPRRAPRSSSLASPALRRPWPMARSSGVRRRGDRHAAPHVDGNTGARGTTLSGDRAGGAQRRGAGEATDARPDLVGTEAAVVHEELAIRDRVERGQRRAARSPRPAPAPVRRAGWPSGARPRSGRPGGSRPVPARR